jgi:hypothetical protein
LIVSGHPDGEVRATERRKQLEARAVELPNLRRMDYLVRRETL